MLGWVSKDVGNLGAQGDGAYLAAGSRRRLRGDRRGNVAIIVAVSAIPVVIAVGAGIDLSRMARAKATLQNAADAAALAGATLYTPAGQQTAAQQTAARDNAQRYFDKYALGGDTTVSTRTVTPAQANAASSPSITVSAAATLPTTFGGLVGLSAMTVNATAVAALVTTTTPHTTTTVTTSPQTPVVQLGTGGGSPSQLLSPSPSKSTASDWNSVYIYGVAKGSNGQYDYSGSPTSFPPLAQFYEIGSNCSGAVDSQWTNNSICNGKPGATVTNISNFTLPADQPIALMFINMNNGMSPSGGAGGYGANQYGSQPGYFQVMTTATMALGQSPSQITDNSANIINALTNNVYARYISPQTSTHYYDVNNSLLSNCAVQIVLVTDVNHPPTEPPYPGVCLSATDEKSGYKYANLSCSQIAGRTFMYWWNDMGASRDDFDYKNLYFTLTCSNTTTNPDGGTIGKTTAVTGQVPATRTTTTTTTTITTTPKLTQ